MNLYTNQEIENALKAIHDMIKRCERMQPKFSEGTSQYTLLVNRIYALRLAEVLMKQACGQAVGELRFSDADLQRSLAPLASIIHKCEKAQGKYTKENKQYKRYINMIDTVKIAYEFVEKEANQ